MVRSVTMETYAIPGFAEPVSSLSHLLSAGIFAVLGFFLLRRGRGSIPRLFALGVFVFTSVFLLSMSGVYHLLSPGGAGHAVLQRLDHAAIFTLIAGSFTPVHWILFTRWGRWGMLLLIWGLAATAISLKVIFFDSIPEWLGLSLYLGLGWIGLASGIALWLRYGSGLVRPLVYSGLSYTLGGLLEFLRYPVLIAGVLGPHEMLHIGVLAGIGFHFRFLFAVLDRYSISALQCLETRAMSSTARALYRNHRYNVSDYYRMAEAGIFNEDSSVELIEGEVVDMPPIGCQHSRVVKFLNHRLTHSASGSAIVAIRNPVRLNDFSEPVPDIALLRPRQDFYAKAHPVPADVLLLVEVSDSTLKYDRKIKVPLYARHGIPEVWLVNMAGREVIVHRQPQAGAYVGIRRLTGREALALAALPGVRVDLAGLFE